MFKQKIMLTVLAESTPTTPQGGGGKDLNQLTVMEENHQTIRQEDLLDLAKMQVLMRQSDSQLPECWQVRDLLPAPCHWGEGIMTGIEGRQTPTPQGGDEVKMFSAESSADTFGRKQVSFPSDGFREGSSAKPQILNPVNLAWPQSTNDSFQAPITFLAHQD